MSETPEVLTPDDERRILAEADLSTQTYGNCFCELCRLDCEQRPICPHSPVWHAESRIERARRTLTDHAEER